MTAKHHTVKIENKVVRGIADVIRGTEYENRVYVVGGFVRDLLMGNEPKDIDLLIDGNIEDGMAFAEWFCKKIGTYEEGENPILYGLYGTAMFQFMGEKIECVAPRSEKYKADSRNPEVSSCSIVDDCYRRDFTVNSMFINISTNELLDYSGHGLDDLKNGIIRSTSEPDIIFEQDPLRLLRAIRFACRLGFEIEDVTFNGIVKNAERIKIIVPERILDELNKIIMCKKPSRGFYMLRRTGLLDIILPELSQLNVIERHRSVGHKNVFAHSLEVLDNVAEKSDNLYLRWAALLHDVGKLKTKEFNEQKNTWTYVNHEVVGAKMIPSIFKRLMLPLDARMEYVRKMVQCHMRPINLVSYGVSDSGVRRLLFDLGDDIDDLMLLAASDITTKKMWKKDAYRNNYVLLKARMVEIEEKDHIRNFQPPVDGIEIMERYHLAPCQMVGLIKERVKNAILNGDIPNEHDAAVSYIEEQFPELVK